MGGYLSSVILFPAPASSYGADFPNLVWIDEAYGDNSVEYHQQAAKRRTRSRGRRKDDTSSAQSSPVLHSSPSKSLSESNCHSPYLRREDSASSAPFGAAKSATSAEQTATANNNAPSRSSTTPPGPRELSPKNRGIPSTSLTSPKPTGADSVPAARSDNGAPSGGAGRGRGASAGGDSGGDASVTFPCVVLRSPTSFSRHVLIYFHGNSCDLGEIYEELDILSDYLSAHILAIEFPGYGVCSANSTPVAERIEKWGRAAFNWLVEHGVSPLAIVLFGRSIGTGPAAALAAHLKKSNVDFGGLVLHSPYTSVHNIVRDYAAVGTWFIPDIWDTESALKSLGPTTPLLIVHGKNDEVVPCYHGEQLYNSYSGNSSVKEAFFPDDCEHNSYLVIDHLGTPLNAFLKAKSLSRYAPLTELRTSSRFAVIPPQYRHLVTPLDQSTTSADRHPPSAPPSRSGTEPHQRLADKMVHHHDGAADCKGHRLVPLHSASGADSGHCQGASTKAPLAASESRGDRRDNQEGRVARSQQSMSPVGLSPANASKESGAASSASGALSLFCSCYPEPKSDSDNLSV